MTRYAWLEARTPHEARVREEILRRAAKQARRRGMDRREFLRSAGGMALALSVVNELECGGKTSRKAGAISGPYCVNDSGEDGAGANLKGTEFIFDIQTHCFDNGEWRTRNPNDVQFFSTFANCSDEPSNRQVDCLNQQHYAELMFIDSDTTMTAITSWPAAQCYPNRSLLGNPPTACGSPLSNEAMRNLRDWINSKAMSQRCVNLFQVMPNDQLEQQLEGMYVAVNDPSWRCVAWEAYPAWPSDTYPAADGSARGYYLTDPIAMAFIEAGLKLGVPNFAVHKGLNLPGFDVLHNEPTDVGPIARMFPDANFMIYHSAINARFPASPAGCGIAPCSPESGPYDDSVPEMTLRGVNVLIRSLLAPNGDRSQAVIANPDRGEPFKQHNVYAEMGSAWAQVMTNPNNAQHYIGKLLKYLGPDNILWGTNSILAGSPQSQIMAFRAFAITQEFQDKYGYPPVTDAIKAKIFGLNAARLFHVDPTAARCRLDRSSFAMSRRELDEGRWG